MANFLLHLAFVVFWMVLCQIFSLSWVFISRTCLSDNTYSRNRTSRIGNLCKIDAENNASLRIYFGELGSRHIECLTLPGQCNPSRTFRFFSVWRGSITLGDNVILWQTGRTKTWQGISDCTVCLGDLRGKCPGRVALSGKGEALYLPYGWPV